VIRAQLSGRLASDPASKTSAAGKPYVHCSVRADVDGESATWARLLAFGSAAERLVDLRRGDAFSAVGQLKVGLYTPKDGGEVRLDLTLLADELLSVRRKRREQQRDDDQAED
jgi:hypothetical protein